MRVKSRKLIAVTGATLAVQFMYYYIHSTTRGPTAEETAKTTPSTTLLSSKGRYSSEQHYSIQQQPRLCASKT